MWTSKETHHTVEMFTEALENKELEIEVEKATIKSNLIKNEADARQQLSQRNDIMVTKADKGGAVVTIDVADYICYLIDT